MIRKGKVGLIKKLLTRNLFEQQQFIDRYEVEFILEHIQKNPRDVFLYNLLCYEKNLLEGEPIDPLTVLPYKFKSLVVRDGLTASEHSDEIDRLHLLWSCNKLYLHRKVYARLEPDLFRETTKVRLECEMCDSNGIGRELAHITGSAFGSKLWHNFIRYISDHTHTYKDYLRCYALSTRIFSKLLAFTTVLPPAKAHELNAIFKLCEINLSEQLRNTLLKSLIPWLLNREHHLTELENYRRCYNHYQENPKITTPPTVMTPLSNLVERDCIPLSQLIDDAPNFEIPKEPICIVYQQQPTAKPYAQSRVLLEVEEGANNTVKPFQGQAEAIANIVQGKYQSALDYFMTTFPLNNEPALAEQFHRATKKADKSLKFDDSNTKALYKLKLAHDTYFRQSLPRPMNSFDLLDKVNFNTMKMMGREDIQI